MGSLLEGIDSSTSAKPKSSGAGGGGSGGGEASKTIKLAFAIAVLLIAGGVIAWNLGLFGSGATSSVDPKAPAGATAVTPEPIMKSTPAAAPPPNQRNTATAPIGVPQH